MSTLIGRLLLLRMRQGGVGITPIGGFPVCVRVSIRKMCLQTFDLQHFNVPYI